MKRFGSAAWSGNLRDGKGSVSTESHALDSYPYTYFSRYGEKRGTNPEELLGAAHAACFVTRRNNWTAGPRSSSTRTPTDSPSLQCIFSSLRKYPISTTSHFNPSQ
jgi:organic hydroperoxide reductase OsmC/OhrA